jgi:hypothetical protein
VSGWDQHNDLDLVEDPLAFWRGLVNAFKLAAVLWACVAVIVWRARVVPLLLLVGGTALMVWLLRRPPGRPSPARLIKRVHHE